MAIAVYKIDNDNYALIDSAESDKIKRIDDLKSQNLLFSAAGAALAIPAAIMSSGALAALMTAAGIYMTVETMLNTEEIRKLEGKDIDFMYLLNQGLAVPGVLLPGASVAARGLQKSESVIQTLDGLGTGYSLATGPVSGGLSALDLYNDRRQYYIDRGEDLNYESWKSALHFRIYNDWRGPESYRGDALKIFNEMTTENGVGADIPKTEAQPIITTNSSVPAFSVSDTLYDNSGNPVMPGWLAIPSRDDAISQAMGAIDKITWPWITADSSGIDNIEIQIGDRTYKTELVTEE
ncbi:MAG: hypothetical protein H6Q72_1917 [Firmicutes bacterium]|nr:hypothetical protein [Bacillota bacterium]